MQQNEIIVEIGECDTFAGVIVVEKRYMYLVIELRGNSSGKHTWPTCNIDGIGKDFHSTFPTLSL